MPEPAPSPRFWFGSAAAFVVVGVIVAWPSLGYYWNWDDLHLIRTYSGAELLGTLSGHWDPDEMETSGLRPMTTLFNHVRALAFGEQVVLHRLFLVGLFAAFLVLLGSAAVKLGESRWAVLLAGIAVLAAKNSYYHFVWIVDGVHILQAVFFAIAVQLLLRYLHGGTRWSALGSLVSALFAITTREDSLAIVPVILLIGHHYVNAGRAGRMEWSAFAVPARLRTFAACLFGLVALLWMWRSAAVPGAARFDPAAPVFTRVGTMMLWTVGLSGQGTARWVCITAGALAAAAVVMLEVAERRRALLWLLAALGTTGIGMVEARTNLLIFPISFYALFLASVAVAVVRQRRWTQVPVALLMIGVVILSVRASRLEQLSLHAMSADQIPRDWEFIYGSRSGATIPSQRRDLLKAKLDRLGVTGADFDFDQWEDALRRSAPDRPDDDKVFLPPRRFLEP